MTTDSSFKIIQNPDGVVLELGPALNENTKLPDMTSYSQVVIDFKNLKHLNSYGLKLWCEWIKSHSSLRTINLDHCPYIFARSLSVVAGMLGGNTKVRSVYAPYYSDETSERKDILFKADVHFKEKGQAQLPEVFDSQGKPMQIDVDPDQYFGFYKV